MINTTQTFIRLRLSIQKITLKVRFPCHVACAIKVDGKEHDIVGESELKNGEAYLNITHNQNVYINNPKDLLSASEKKCALLVYLKSTSGKIPAGTVVIPLNKAEGITHRELNRIQKCPDKNAIIQYEIYTQRFDNKYQKEAESTIEKILYPFNNENKIRSSVYERQQSPHRNILYNRNKSGSKKIFRSSQVDVSLGGKETIPLGRNQSRKELESGSSILEEYYMQKRNNGSQREKVFTLERQLESSKAKMHIMQSELSSKSNRVVELQKDARQLNKKMEQLELDLRSNASKLQMSEKTNKELSNQIKTMKQKLSEEKLSFENAIKRVQIRQISAKQQIKALNQKLYSSENQKQKYIFQKNQLTNDYQVREKKLRESFKEKEKKTNEERSNLLKKIDSLEKDIQKLYEDINEYKQKNNDLLQNNHELRLIIQSLQAQKQRIRNENNDLKFELTKSRNEKKLLEESLESNNRFNEERRNYRKQLNEKEIEITQLKQKISILESTYNRSKASIEQVEKALKERNNHIKTIQRDYNILVKENKLIINDLGDKDTKLNSMIQQFHNESKKCKMLQKKCEQLNQALEDNRYQKNYHQSEHEQRINILEEEIEKLNQELFGYSQKIEQIEKENCQLQQAVDQKQEHIQNLYSNLIQVNEANQQYQFQKLEIAEEKREMQEIFTKRLEEAEQEVKFVNSKIKELTLNYQQQLNNNYNNQEKHHHTVNQIQTMLKQKQDKLTKINAKNVKIQRQLESALQKIDSNEQIINKLKKDNETLIQKCKEIKRQIQDSEQINNSIRMNNASLQSEINQIQMKLDNSHAELRREQAIKQINQSTFNSYKAYSLQAIDFIINEVKNRDFNIIIEHPDQQFCSKSNTLCQKIVKINCERESQIQHLKSKLGNLQKQLVSLFEQKQNKELDLNHISKSITQLKKSTFEYSQEINIKRSQVQSLQLEIMKKDQSIEQLSKQYSKKINHFTALLATKNKEILEISQKMKEWESDINQLQNENYELSERNKKLQKDKALLQNQWKSRFHQKENALREQLEKITSLQKDRGDLEKQLKGEKQNLRKALRELQSKCRELQETQHKTQDIQMSLKLSESEYVKYKHSFQEMKAVLQHIITKVEYYQVDDRKEKNKIESIIASCHQKENEYLFRKAKDFYIEYLTTLQCYNQKEKLVVEMEQQLEGLTYQLQNSQKEKDKFKQESMMKSSQQKIQREEEREILAQQNNRLVAQINDLELELSKRQKERTANKKELEQMRATFNEVNKQVERDKDLKTQMIKYVQDQTNGVEGIRRLNQQMLKVSVSLQKQKKVSMFAIIPLKEMMKRLQYLVTPLKKSSEDLMNKYRKQPDLLAKRSKKKTSLNI